MYMTNLPKHPPPQSLAPEKNVVRHVRFFCYIRTSRYTTVFFDLLLACNWLLGNTKAGKQKSYHGHIKKRGNQSTVIL